MDSGRDHPKVGLPHSEIRGSGDARSSPRLIAACYVLRRLSVPRHPPDALITLDPSYAGTNPRPTNHYPRGHVESPLGLPARRARSGKTYSRCQRATGARLVAGRHIQIKTGSADSLETTRRSLDAATIGENRWWRRTGSNRRPQACKARALPTELRPHFTRRIGHANRGRQAGWWAREDLNLRPHAYQACALTS